MHAAVLRLLFSTLSAEKPTREETVTEIYYPHRTKTIEIKRIIPEPNGAWVTVTEPIGYTLSGPPSRSTREPEVWLVNGSTVIWGRLMIRNHGMERTCRTDTAMSAMLNAV
jgi:hypothetical protein